MRLRAAWVAAAMALAACSAPDERPRAESTSAGGDSGGAARPGTQGPHASAAVQVGSFADSVRARALDDSLRRSGWRTVVAGTTVEGARRWRVLVNPTNDAALARTIVTGFRADGRAALVVELEMDGVPDPGIRIAHANRGTHGMFARTFWALSPDGRTLIAMEDPAAVEAEPVPNGFVVAREGDGVLWQQDGVWHAAPSPDWRDVAFSRGWILQGEREGAVPASRYAALARRIPDAAWARLAPRADATQRIAALQAAKFPGSGMSIADAVAITFVVSLDSMRGRDASDGWAAGAVRIGGWRVGWTRDGASLAVGRPPAAVQDHTPAPSYVLVAKRGRGDSTGTATPDALARVQWTEGPMLDGSDQVDMRAARTVTAGTRRIEGKNGWIVVSDGREQPRVIGPGMPLAATATGRFIVALVPNADPRPYETRAVLAVYDVP